MVQRVFLDDAYHLALPHKSSTVLWAMVGVLKDRDTIVADNIVVKVFGGLGGGKWVDEPCFWPFHKHFSACHDAHCPRGMGRGHANYGINHIVPERASPPFPWVRGRARV